MILSISNRCDISFYTPWLKKRLEEGFVDVRNPVYPKMVSRIFFKDVDAYLFISKNPSPLIEIVRTLDKPVIFHVTITPYKKEIEKVKDKTNVIESVKKLSEILGKDNVVVRYDPIFISDTYTLSYHIKAFKRLCSLLNGYINTIIVSFLDIYQNVKRNNKVLGYKQLTEEDLKTIGLNFSKIANENGMHVQTCFEKETLTEYGFVKGECLSKELARKLTNKNFPKWKARKGGICSCVQMTDIGAYNMCMHLCKYCYANYDEKNVLKNVKEHDPKSSMIFGHLNKDDKIVVKQK